MGVGRPVYYPKADIRAAALKGRVGSATVLRIQTETPPCFASSALSIEPVDLESADDAIGTAISIFEERHLNLDLAWAVVVQGQVLKAKSDNAGAKGAFNRAAQMFREMGIKRDLKRVEIELESIAE